MVELDSLEWNTIQCRSVVCLTFDDIIIDDGRKREGRDIMAAFLLEASKE